MDDINVVEQEAPDKDAKIPTEHSSLEEVFAYFKLGLLDFLWLEITSQCNNRCIHCYNRSAPKAPSNGNLLHGQDYYRLLKESAALGCKKTQLTGGEPALNPDLPGFIEEAVAEGYKFIEVFTNLVSLPQPVLDVMQKHKVNVATSFYSSNPETHDSITGNPGSHRCTSENIKRVIQAGLTLRAGIITMPQNEKDVQPTTEYLISLGMKPGTMRPSPVRGIGRGENVKADKDTLTKELCGYCWRGSICVSPEGEIYPCIMSRHMVAGNVKETGLEQLVQSQALKQHREEIYHQVWFPREEMYRKARLTTTLEAGCSPTAECPPMCVPSAIRAWL